MKTDILGVRFDNVTLEEAVEHAARLLEQEGWGYVVTPNPEIVWLCREDPSLLPVVNGAALVLADGVGIIKAAAMLDRPMKEKVPGIDFAAALAARMAREGKRLYLLGAKPGVAELAAAELCKRCPGLQIAGTADGYFKDNIAAAEQIRQSGADVAFVCLGAPKQERWMAEFGEGTGARLLVGLGGSLDVFAGKVERAPERWQKMGLEWLYRLLKEPKRLGRMMSLPKFLLCVRKEKGKGAL